MDIENAPRLRRREAIPPSDQTQRRDEVAEVIEYMWPASKTAIAEEAESTRRTVTKVLETYFEPDTTEGDVPDLDGLETILDDDEEKLLAVFRMGYRMGWEDRDELD